MNNSNDELMKLESKLQSTRLQGEMDDDAHGLSLLLPSLLENAKSCTREWRELPRVERIF